MTRLIVVFAIAILAVGCASTGAVPRPFPVPGGTPPTAIPAAPATPELPGAPVVESAATPSPADTPAPPSTTTGSADGYSISTTALSLRGAPYRNGGDDPAGFDCSGFVKYVFEQHGRAMPREVRRQYGEGTPVEPSGLEPGDLVFFTTVAPGASHVGIAIGGDQFVHAPSTTGVVRVEHLTAPYWWTRFVGAKRLN